METKHTKGEWSHTAYGYTSKGEIIIAGSDNFGNLLAEVYKQRDAREQEANAKLIAAAPKLLEALKCVEMALFELNIKETAINSIVTKAIKEATE